MAWWEWLVGILLFIVALGVLIGIHELGHLSMAKLFKVYCFNYSIGFGPALISSKRTKKHETIWTLRAIPLGGFVSMYGEGAELDTDEYIPPSRSLEGVARYKRAIIVSAGVILNTLLGFVLILFSNLGVQTKFYFYQNPNAPYESNIVLNTNSNNKTDIKAGDALWAVQDPVSGEFVLDLNPVTKTGTTNNYMFCFSNSVTTTKTDPKLSDSIVFYKAVTVTEAINNGVTNFSNDKKFGFIPGQNRADVLTPLIIANDSSKDYQTEYNRVKGMKKEDQVNEYKSELDKAYTNRGFKTNDSAIITSSSENYYHPKAGGETFNTVTLTYYKQPVKGVVATKAQYNVTIKSDSKSDKWADIGLTFKRNQYRYTASQVFSKSWKGWCNANVAVIRGVGAIFTGQGQVSGIVGIAQISSQTLANYGFSRYLSLWGMISCNLAIINLLPFPGLDGFTLVVTAYEGIRKKQVPAKLKGILSFIGLALLFTLMIAVLVMDIGRLIP